MGSSHKVFPSPNKEYNKKILTTKIYDFARITVMLIFSPLDVVLGRCNLKGLCFSILYIALREVHLRLSGTVS